MSVQLFHLLLQDLNADVNQYETMKRDAALVIILSYAFDSEKKMNLPEGVPEFKPDRAPLYMSPSTLRFESKRLYVFNRSDVTDKKRQTLFVQMLESIHPLEAEVLCLIKDQKLHLKYSNLTHEWAASVGLRCPVSKEEQKSSVSQPTEESVVEVESASVEVVQGPVSEESTEVVSVDVAEESVSEEVSTPEVKDTKKKGKK